MRFIALIFTLGILASCSSSNQPSLARGAMRVDVYDSVAYYIDYVTQGLPQEAEYIYASFGDESADILCNGRLMTKSIDGYRYQRQSGSDSAFIFRVSDGSLLATILPDLHPILQGLSAGDTISLDSAFSFELVPQPPKQSPDSTAILVRIRYGNGNDVTHGWLFDPWGSNTIGVSSQIVSTQYQAKRGSGYFYVELLYDAREARTTYSANVTSLETFKHVGVLIPVYWK